MTSEAKIYSLLSKEWKINRYGPWIFHKNAFTRPPPLDIEDFKEIHVHVILSAHQNLWTKIPSGIQS